MRIALLALLLTACTTLGNFSSGMDTLIGKPSQNAFDRLGFPDRQEVIAGRTVYFYGTDQERGPSCAFKIVTENDVVRSWDGIGNAWGCDMYLKGLSR